VSYIIIVLALLLVACAKEPDKRVTIPEQAPVKATQQSPIPWVPCPSGVPRICCKDKRSCE